MPGLTMDNKYIENIKKNDPKYYKALLKSGEIPKPKGEANLDVGSDTSDDDQVHVHMNGESQSDSDFEDEDESDNGEEENMETTNLDGEYYYLLYESRDCFIPCAEHIFIL